MSAKKKSKRKKYIPAYIAIYGIVFVIIMLFIVIICNVVSCGRGGDKPEESADTTPDAEETTPRAEITAAPETNAPVDDKDAWMLYVIGNDNPLPDDFSIETKLVSNGLHLDERCADYARQMFADAAEQNVGLYLTSAYRTVQKQKENLENYINTLMSQGYTKDEATAQAKKEIAAPGCSEHNMGLAMDVVSDNWWNTHSDLDESFDKTPQYEWLIENSWKYGFILSYPKGKEGITGFIYEPWHYRFVGLKHAEKIHQVYVETGEFLTLNEYIAQYTK